MGALPKRKYAKARQGKRRVNLKLLPVTQLSSCSQCNSPKLSHRVCPTCGTYDGREVIEIKSPQKKTG
ncbi:MAG: 50S ribosomal protein L32 [Dehalococcoidales bacterium]|jgi:large subunit ribosomal protein L32|nr:50S ribosomal protein L32 [Dehalococcoidales bacterium]